MPDLLIPDKIKVGFQERNDTFTKKLSYIIYYDNKGKLRKEASWKTWCDNKIPSEEYANEPTEGFVLNKGIRRNGWSHFSTQRSMIRVYDPRGMEFEITPENLLGILMETDCSKRCLDGKFVYAWAGTELVLLPCNSEEYVKAKKYTERQSKKVSSKGIIPGCSYTTKKGDEVVYMGHLPWYSLENKGFTMKKVHLFACDDKKANYFSWSSKNYSGKFFGKGSLDFLSEINNPETVINYASLVDEWASDSHSSGIKSIEFEEFKITENDLPKNNTLVVYKKYGDSIKIFYITNNRNYLGYTYKEKKSEYKFYLSATFNTVNFSYERNENYYSYYDNNYASKENLLESENGFVKVYVILNNGSKIELKDFGR